METKLVSTPQNYNCSMGFACAVQLGIFLWRACTWPAEQQSIQNVLHVFVLYNRQRVMLEVIGPRDQGYAPQLHQSFYTVGIVLRRPEML